MFPPIPPLINVDMIYQYQPNPFVGFVPGFSHSPIIQQIPQQNPFLSQLLHTQQMINNQILQNASISASMFAQQQQQYHQEQSQQLEITSSLPTSSTTEINDIDLTSFQGETNFGDNLLKIATWNVRGAVEMDKRNAIDKCLNEKMVQIACIQETNLQMTSLETANYKWHFINRKNDHNLHCGTAILVRHRYKAAVSNFEEVTGNILSCFVRSKELTILLISAHFTEEFGTEIEFERLKNFLKLYESLPTIILGDFNAQLGKSDIVDADHVYMGRYLYHDKCNNNGRLLKDLASEAKLFIKNTFRSHKIYKWKFILTTCRLKEKTSMSKAEESQIDHILTSRDGIVFVKMLRGYYRNNVRTDHKMIVADIEIRNFVSNEKSDVIDLSLDDEGPAELDDLRGGRSGAVDSEHQNLEESTLKANSHQEQEHRNQKKSKDTVPLRGHRPTDEPSQNTNQNIQQIIEIDSDNLEVTEPIKMQICPGEPVPPGFEDMVKPVAELQVILSKYRTSPLIGLEYVIELIMGDRRPRTYHCALCDKICDTKDIIDHIKSYEHRCKYLEKHFSTVMITLSQYRQNANSKSVLASVIGDVCDAIEDAYGRMVPNVFENNDYTANRAMYMKKLAKERHFDEKSGSTFVGVIDHKAIQSAFEAFSQNTTNNAGNTSVTKRSHSEVSVRTKRNSCDSISSSDSMKAPAKSGRMRSLKGVEPVVIDRINLDLISSDSDDDSSNKKRKRENSYKPSNYKSSSSYSKSDETEEFKYERYKRLTDKAVHNLTILLKEYEKYPEKHPMYPSEWKRYWSRRSKELESVGMDPLKFDFSSEWSKFWLRRLRELYDDEIALKKFEIRKKLNLSADYYPRSSSSIYNEPSSSFGYDSEENRLEKSRMKSHYPMDQMEDVDAEALTVISVLRLLAALEDLLGATLGKKVLDLLSKAVHLEKLKANLADDVLMNEENSVLLATVKEKLKGLIIAKIVNNQQMNAVRRAIRNVEAIVAVIDDKLSVGKTKKETAPHQSDQLNISNDQNWKDSTKTQRDSQQSFNNVRNDNGRSEIREQIATGFLIQKINISNERLEELTDFYMAQSRDTAETPYLFGVRVSQNELDYVTKSNNPSSHAHSSSSGQSQMKEQNSASGGGSGTSSFAFNFFDRNVGNVSSLDNASFSSANLGNANNFFNRSNNPNDSYSQSNSNQSNQFRSQDKNQFNHQNLTHQSSSFNHQATQQSNQSNQQRFQQQNSANLHQHHSKSSSQQMNKINHSNQSTQKIPSLLDIWEEPMMANHGKVFDKKAKINSIWDTNPIQNQQQFNQGMSQSNTNQQSQFNNFSKYPQNYGLNSSLPVWDHQFSQQQNSRNSRYQ